MSLFGTRSCQLSMAASLVMLSELLCPAAALAGPDKSTDLYAPAANLYVLEQGLNQVQVVRTGGNGFPAAITATIPVGNVAVKAKGSPDQKSVWVTNGGDGTITIISTADNSTRLISTASAGEVACIPNNFPTPCTAPSQLLFNSRGTQAFLADVGDNTVKIIDPTSDRVLNAIPVGNLPAGIALTPDGSRLYVTNLLDNTVSVISTASKTVLTTISMPGSTFHGSVPASCSGTGTTLSEPSPTGIAITPDGRFAFVTNAYDNNLTADCQPFEPSTVSVIRIADNTVINPSNPIPSGGFLATAINFLPGWCPGCATAFVANTGTDNFPDNRIGTIDAGHRELINVTTEPAPIIGPSEIDPIHRLTYVPNIGNGTTGESIVTLSNYSGAVANTFALPAGSFVESIAVIY